MTQRPTHSTAAAGTLRDHELSDQLVAVLEHLATIVRPELVGRVCARCGGLRPRGFRPCDVCDAIRRHREVTALVEDIQWLAGTDTPGSIARRVGYDRPEALSRRLSRYGYHDLAAMFDRRADRRRTAA